MKILMMLIIMTIEMLIAIVMESYFASIIIIEFLPPFYHEGDDFQVIMKIIPVDVVIVTIITLMITLTS